MDNINKLTIEYRNQTNVFKTARFTIPNESIIGILQNLGVLDKIGMKAHDSATRIVFGGAKANLKKNKIVISLAAADITPGFESDIGKQRELEAEVAKRISESLDGNGSDVDKVISQLATVKAGFTSFFMDKSLQAVLVKQPDLFAKAKTTLTTFNTILNDLNNLKAQVGE